VWVCLFESLCLDLQELECAVSASQQEASSKHSRLEGEITDLKALVEAEVNKARQAEEQHKAAQAELALKLDVASSLTRRLENSQAELLSQVCVGYSNRALVPAIHRAFEPRSALQTLVHTLCSPNCSIILAATSLHIVQAM